MEYLQYLHEHHKNQQNVGKYSIHMDVMHNVKSTFQFQSIFHPWDREFPSRHPHGWLWDYKDPFLNNLATYQEAFRPQKVINLCPVDPMIQVREFLGFKEGIFSEIS